MYDLTLYTNGMTFHTNSLLLVKNNFYGQFPNCVKVVSSNTGNIVKFFRDIDAEIANEGWDGEECHYIGSTPRGKMKLVLCRA